VQRSVLRAAATSWQEALGQQPFYFRSGYFSANDSTFEVLEELGFRGSSISNPGRVLPEHQSVWAGTEPYPHKVHLAFRQLRGTSRLVEVPISVDYQRPVQKGAAGEKGYEWLYIPAAYNHREIVRDLLKRAKVDMPPIFALVLDTHNDQDYFDPQHAARMNLDLILGSVESLCEEMDLRPVGATLESMCDLVLSGDPLLDGRSSRALGE